MTIGPYLSTDHTETLIDAIAPAVEKLLEMQHDLSYDVGFEAGANRG